MARRDSRTTDLFDWKPPQVAVGYGREVAGSGALDSKIARLISQALRDVRDGEKQLSRAEVAGFISLELHRPVSEAMLAKWTSEASDSHRIPLDAFIALVKVTEAEDLLGFIPDLLGFAVVPKAYTEIIQLHLIEEKERELQAHKDQIKARMRSRS
jgi:hypothetical protein